MVISVAKASLLGLGSQPVPQGRPSSLSLPGLRTPLDTVRRTAQTGPMSELKTAGERCFGTGDAAMERYHDEEWGRAVRGDVELFERIALEGFQSGLSWATVLRKRENFRMAFAGWDARAIARFGDDDVARLMDDAGIIRNRVKIDSTITNARALVALWDSGETLADLVWLHAPAAARPGTLHSWADIPTSTDESKALAKALKARGFVFVGPITMYALMQACGMVDVHLDTCPARSRFGRP